MSYLSAISWSEQVTFQSWYPLCGRPRLFKWSFMPVAHWNNSPRVNIPLHLGTFFWFWANQSLFLLFSSACLAGEAINTNFMIYVWRDRGSNARLIALEASTRTFTPHYMYYMTTTHSPSFIYNNSIFICICICNIISFTWKCLWTAYPPGELELTSVFFTCLSGVPVVQCC